MTQKAYSPIHPKRRFVEDDTLADMVQPITIPEIEVESVRIIGKSKGKNIELIMDRKTFLKWGKKLK
jgi:hypothetical protein